MREHARGRASIPARPRPYSSRGGILDDPHARIELSENWYAFDLICDQLCVIMPVAGPGSVPPRGEQPNREVISMAVATDALSGLLTYTFATSAIAAGLFLLFASLDGILHSHIGHHGHGGHGGGAVHGHDLHAGHGPTGHGPL